MREGALSCPIAQMQGKAVVARNTFATADVLGSKMRVICARIV